MRKSVLTTVLALITCALLGAIVAPFFASPFLGAQAHSEIPANAVVNESAGSLPQSSATASPKCPPAPASREPQEMTDLSAAGFSGEDQNRLINNGVTPAYILELKNAGYSGLTANQLIAFRSNNVRTAYIDSQFSRILRLVSERPARVEDEWHYEGRDQVVSGSGLR